MDNIKPLRSDGEFSATWREHFSSAHRRLPAVGYARSLDHPHERWALQIYANVLEATGPLNGKALCDAGCGWGVTSLIFKACGARVTAIDIVPETIASLRQAHPEIRWMVADLTTKKHIEQLPMFDIIVASEVLQYIDPSTAIPRLWSRVAPAGRLVGCVPNLECPLAKRVVDRDGPGWQPVSVPQVSRWAQELPDVSGVRLRAMTFQQDQTFLPYFAGPWTRELQGVPNRILFVLFKK